MKFNEYMEVFFNERALSLAPVTILNYRRELERAASYLGDKDMNEICLTDLKQYFVNLQGNVENHYNNHLLKHGTILQHYIILHAFFENAKENELIASDPMDRLKPPKPRKDEVVSEPMFYGKNKLKYILGCVEKEPPMWKALMFFVIDSGCRCGEAMALKWEEIDFRKGIVTICRNAQYTPEKGVYICTPKNGKNRKIYLNRNVLDIMSEWKKIQEIQLKTRNMAHTGYCFTKKDGNLMMPGCFNSYLNRFGKKYGVKGIHPHALRHSMATLSITNGADIVSISKKLGHSKVSVTLNVYSHATEEAQRRANAVLAKVLYK